MTTLPPILRLGFRPFFLAAAVYAALGMAAWGLAWFTAWPPTAIPAPLWHAHEMLYGYALAVVAGFLLTAVRNWTGLPTARGGALAALLALWCAARLGYFLGPAALPYVAALDLGFDLLLLAAVATPIVRVRQWRQAGILAKLVLLITGNALFYLGVMGQVVDGTFYALHGGVFVLVALILTIAEIGRAHV